MRRSQQFWGSSMRVLVIEDEVNIRLNIMEILDSDGFDAIAAEDGAMGLTLVQETQPDLVICDIKMPRLDGYQVLSELRENPRTAAIPFIFLTAKADWSDQRRGMNLGADDYLPKPFRRRELLNAVKARLQHQARQQAALIPSVALPTPPPKPEDPVDLVSLVTHDLQAPLTTIRTALQLIESRPERCQQYLAIARQACQQGETLIQMVLHLARVEAGHTVNNVEDLDLTTWCRDLQSTFPLQSAEKEQILEISLPTDLPPIAIEVLSFQRIVVELLNNARKYTPAQGKICLQVETISPVPGQRSDCEPAKTENRDPQKAIASPNSAHGEPTILQIQVSNQAEIATEDLPHIFEKFYQGHRRPSRSQGTGLGLALVKALIDQHQGQIQVTSTQGWTTFQIRLPGWLSKNKIQPPPLMDEMNGCSPEVLAVNHAVSDYPTIESTDLSTFSSKVLSTDSPTVSLDKWQSGG
ncbi:MAG: response regulator [Synechococcales bacterium]|nr:response regulator [Synechococcales bacterium]